MNIGETSHFSFSNGGRSVRKSDLYLALFFPYVVPSMLELPERYQKTTINLMIIFYFPGVFYAINLLRKYGPIKDKRD